MYRPSVHFLYSAYFVKTPYLLQYFLCIVLGKRFSQVLILTNAMCAFILRQRRRNFFLYCCKFGRRSLPNLQQYKKIIAKSTAMRLQKNMHIGLTTYFRRSVTGHLPSKLQDPFAALVLSSSG